MARKARAEVEGGLYHVITRGNNRRQTFIEYRKDRRPDPDLFFSYIKNCLVTGSLAIRFERATFDFSPARLALKRLQDSSADRNNGEIP
jgi:hypothetical protein